MGGGAKGDKSDDPMAGIMDLMKGMYEEGDDQMKVSAVTVAGAGASACCNCGCVIFALSSARAIAGVKYIPLLLLALLRLLLPLLLHLLCWKVLRCSCWYCRCRSKLLPSVCCYFDARQRLPIAQ